MANDISNYHPFPGVWERYFQTPEFFILASAQVNGIEKHMGYHLFMTNRKISEQEQNRYDFFIDFP
jgi:hypothetical protein